MRTREAWAVQSQPGAARGLGHTSRCTSHCHQRVHLLCEQGRTMVRVLTGPVTPQSAQRQQEPDRSSLVSPEAAVARCQRCCLSMAGRRSAAAGSLRPCQTMTPRNRPGTCSQSSAQLQGKRMLDEGKRPPPTQLQDRHMMAGGRQQTPHSHGTGTCWVDTCG